MIPWLALSNPFPYSILATHVFAIQRLHETLRHQRGFSIYEKMVLVLESFQICALKSLPITPLQCQESTGSAYMYRVQVLRAEISNLSSTCTCIDPFKPLIHVSDRYKVRLFTYIS